MRVLAALILISSQVAAVSLTVEVHGEKFYVPDRSFRVKSSSDVSDWWCCAETLALWRGRSRDAEALASVRRMGDDQIVAGGSVSEWLEKIGMGGKYTFLPADQSLTSDFVDLLSRGNPAIVVLNGYTSRSILVVGITSVARPWPESGRTETVDRIVVFVDPRRTERSWTYPLSTIVKSWSDHVSFYSPDSSTVVDATAEDKDTKLHVPVYGSFLIGVPDPKKVRSNQDLKDNVNRPRDTLNISEEFFRLRPSRQ